MRSQENENIVKYTVGSGIAFLTINRPDRMNAINDAVIQQLMNHFNKIASDEAINVIVLTGSGDQAFCSGADLKDPNIGHTELYAEYLEKYYQSMIKMIMGIKKPVIASINGAVVGAGIGLALACDYLIMAEDAYFYPAFARIGLVPDSGVMTFLVRRMGKYRAFEAAALARMISSDEAKQYGMVNKVVPFGKLMKETRNTAEAFLGMPPVTVGLIKHMANRIEDMSLSDALEMEKDFQEIAANTKDHEEGIKAFIEKREPNFTGK